MELIEWLLKISILNIFILKCQVLSGFEIADIISFECEKGIWSIFDGRYFQNGLSSGQYFSINTKPLPGTFSKRNMEDWNSKLCEKMNMQNALCGTFWL